MEKFLQMKENDKIFRFSATFSLFCVEFVEVLPKIHQNFDFNKVRR